MGDLTAIEARKVWRYEPDTGFFYWQSPRYDALIGSKAGYFDGKYWRLNLQGKKYKASRVAWLYVTGSWPKDQIDHVDGDRRNDSFSNLREATNAENCRNRKVKSTNKLGIKGVHKIKRGFRAQVMVNGRHVLHKDFRTLEEAKSAYDAVAAKLHGEFARL